MEAEKKSKLQIFECSACGQTGKANQKKCSACGGFGLLGLAGDHLIYWGQPINSFYLYQKNLAKIINRIIDLLLFLFGAIGFLMLIWEIALISKFQFYPNLIIDIWNTGSWKTFLFWFSLITDAYLYYRLARRQDLLNKIPKKLKQQQNKKIQNMSWDKIKKLKPDQFIDISTIFSADALSSVYKSWELAKKYNHQKIGPPQLLISLLTYPEIANMFIRMAVSFDKLKHKIIKVLVPYQIPTGKDLEFTKEFYIALFHSFYEAWLRRQKKVELPDILIGIIKSDQKIQELLYDLEVDIDKIGNIALWIRVNKILKQNYEKFRHRALFRPKSSINRSMTAIATPFLDNFGTDLTALAKAGYLAPCVGRDKEIDNIFRACVSGNRTSVILVGNPGVGKRAIINGIAQLMVAETVPKQFSDKRLISLSIAKIISGVAPAQAQQRLLILIDEALRSGNIILFINDISGMIGITPGGASSADLADVLTQAVSRYKLTILSSSTPADYARYIEAKSSLDEIFDKIIIDEPKGNSAIQILEAKAGPIEYKYAVYFSYDAIAKAVELSDRYLHDRFLPEKAIEILEESAAKLNNTKGKNALVELNDVASIISEKTEIPLTEITRQEKQKLLNLELEIHKRLINQEEAVNMVSAALRRARAELRDTKRPISNFLFLGPTGVGKTELAKSITEVYFGAEGKMIRVDMSEYPEKSAVGRLIGEPNNDVGGYLTEKVREHPFSLVLLDEIEKAHPNILNLFLQVMDDGRLTDAAGKTIDFTNTIIIATSNACSITIQNLVEQGQTAPEIKNKIMEKEIYDYFRPEFLNRMDGVIIFKPLSLQNVLDITRLMLKQVADNLQAKGIFMSVEDDAIKYLADAGFDPKFGARPLRRVIQEKISNNLANYILAGKISRRDRVVLKGAGEIEIVKAEKS